MIQTQMTEEVFLSLKDDLELFWAAHAETFHGYGGGDDEHRFEFTEIFHEFEALIDSRLTGFAQEEGFDSVKDLFQTVEAVAEEDPRAAKMVQLVLAASDYEQFVRLMWLKARGGQQAANSAK